MKNTRTLVKLVLLGLCLSLSSCNKEDISSLSSINEDKTNYYLKLDKSQAESLESDLIGNYNSGGSPSGIDFSYRFTY